jgi:hypothetical protein
MRYIFMNYCANAAIPFIRTSGLSRWRALSTLVRPTIAFAVVALLLSVIALQPALADDDPRDRVYIMDQVNQALETQRTKVVTPRFNPETGNGGTIVVEKTFYRDTGEPCRDFRRTLDRSDAPPLITEGTGCRIGPARWEIDEKTTAVPEKSKTTTAGTKKAAKKPTPTTAPAKESAAAGGAPDCPAPTSLGPPFTVVKAPCGKPPAFTAYTMPSKAEL